MTLMEDVSVPLGPARKTGAPLPLTIQAGDLWGRVGRSLPGDSCAETPAMAMAKVELTTGSARREASSPSVEGVAAPHAHLARRTVAWLVHFIWGRGAVVPEFGKRWLRGRLGSLFIIIESSSSLTLTGRTSPAWTQPLTYSHDHASEARVLMTFLPKTKPAGDLGSCFVNMISSPAASRGQPSGLATGTEGSSSFLGSFPPQHCGWVLLATVFCGGQCS